MPIGFVWAIYLPHPGHGLEGNNHSYPHCFCGSGIQGQFAWAVLAWGFSWSCCEMLAAPTFVWRLACGWKTHFAGGPLTWLTHVVLAVAGNSQLLSCGPLCWAAWIASGHGGCFPPSQSNGERERIREGDDHGGRERGTRVYRFYDLLSSAGWKESLKSIWQSR